MARKLRPHLPGVVFHITARIQGREALFADLERLIVVRILAARARSDASLIAYAVMPNHLHIVLRQGNHRLSDFMQPLLTRISRLVQQRRSAEGHIFERRYFATPCLNPDYARNAIAYVHLNAVRAGLVDNIDSYPWSSHAYFDRQPPTPGRSMADLPIECALRLFASLPDQSLRECRLDYRRFVEWRCAEDAHRRRVAEGIDSVSPDRPCTDGGDQHWTREYATAADGLTPLPARSRIDLSQLAQAVIREMVPGMDIELLRSGDQGRAVVRVRRYFIVRAHEAGYRGGRIARYLGISHSTVSRTITDARRAAR